MNLIIMRTLAVCAVLGGIDKLLGNRFGLGKRFDEGFDLLGPLAAGMSGILVLSPLMAKGLQAFISPLFIKIGIDPAVAASLLAIDMGGYPLAMELGIDRRVALYSGIIAASIFGCTVSFTIPVGFSLADKRTSADFALGTIYGLIAMPVGLIIGGAACGLSVLETIRQSLPLMLLSVLMMIGIRLNTPRMIRVFNGFAWFIRLLCVGGAVLGTVEYLTGFALIPGLMSMKEAMTTAVMCGIAMLGSLPFMGIVTALLKKPLAALGTKLRMNDCGISSMVMSIFSVTTSLAAVRDMDRRSLIVNAALFVSAADALSAHLGFCAAVEPQLVSALLAAKLSGGVAALLLALVLTRKLPAGSEK